MRDAKTVERERGDLEVWLAALPDGAELAATAARLRAAAGGAAVAGGADPALVASYFDPGPRDAAALQRLLGDPQLRRAVAGVGRILDGPALTPPRTRRPTRTARWAAGIALALAASLAVVAILPRSQSTAPHRAATIAADELHVLTPAGALSGPPAIAWERALTADLYEVEITRADGRPVFTGRTVDTMIRLPDTLLAPGVSYFFRVRARVDAGRWIVSDFRELVVRP